MSTDHGRLDVGQTATSIFTGVDASDSSQGCGVMLTNEGPETVYGGGSTVTFEDYGWKLELGEKITLDTGVGDNPFIVSETGTNVVRAFYLGL